MLFQSCCDAVDLTDTVFMVDQLLFHDFFYTDITLVDIADICNLPAQMFLQFLALQTHGTDLVTHISYNKSQDKQLGNPHIGIVIHKYLKSASRIHLPEHISCNRQYCRKSSLLLSVHNGKKQHIQKERIKICKILASYSPVIHHKKRNKADHVFEKREKHFDQPSPFLDKNLPPGKLQLIFIQKNIFMPLHVSSHILDIFFQISQCMNTVFLFKTSS